MKEAGERHDHNDLWWGVCADGLCEGNGNGIGLMDRVPLGLFIFSVGIYSLTEFGRM